MVAHLINNNPISDHQHGFTINKSCITQLLLIMEHWSKLIDQGNTIYLAFQKAFDTVPHQHLNAKMKMYNFSNSTVNLISSFLTSSKQRVVVNDEWHTSGKCARTGTLSHLHQ